MDRRRLPSTLRSNRSDIKSLNDIETWVSLEDFAIEGYKYHDAIDYPFSV